MEKALFGAGCFTFQNRMTLCIQVHPELTTDPAVCRKWIQEWVAAIEHELAQPAANPAPAASTDVHERSQTTVTQNPDSSTTQSTTTHGSTDQRSTQP